MKTLVIERDALKNNLEVIRERAGSAAIYAVLAGDAFGMGAVELAKLLRDEGISRFAVGEVSEAAALRKAGLTEEELLMLRSTVDREEIQQLLDLGVTCTIGSTDAGLALNGVAETRSTVAEAHLQINTGTGYGGFLTGEPDKLFSVYRDLPNIAVSGIYTQIFSAKKRGKDIDAQLAEFQKIVEAIHAQGFETGVVHTAEPCSLPHDSCAQMDAVQVGSALLGRCRRSRNDGLTRVGYGEVRIGEIRWLPKGHTVGDETQTVLKAPVRAAVLPVGYQNGLGVDRTKNVGFWARLCRRAGKKLTVRIGGEKVRLIGCAGAIETLVDVTDLQCVPGNVAVFDIDPVYARGFVREYR